jgi:hypothetical protein
MTRAEIVAGLRAETEMWSRMASTWRHWANISRDFDEVAVAERRAALLEAAADMLERETTTTEGEG